MSDSDRERIDALERDLKHAERESRENLGLAIDEREHREQAESALLSLQRAVRELKHFTLPMHGHSTCAADPEVVKWDDVLALLPDPAGTTP